jgi:hypothetical protein
VATATQGLPLTSGVTNVGPLATTTPVTVVVALALHNTSTLDQDIAAGDVMSERAFKSGFAPTAAQVSSVKSYLKSKGLKPGSVTANNLLVSATGPTSAVEAAFNTSLASVSVDGKAGYANLGAVDVPAALGSTVVSVLGRPPTRRARAPSVMSPTPVTTTHRACRRRTVPPGRPPGPTRPRRSSPRVI